MIFLSYSSHDRRIAMALVDKFNQAGLNVWFDCLSLNLNLPIYPQLKNAILNSTIVCLIDSQYSRNSSWVSLELEVQACNAIPLISFFPEQCVSKVPTLFAEFLPNNLISASSV